MNCAICNKLLENRLRHFCDDCVNEEKRKQELAAPAGSVQTSFHAPTVSECARLCDWKLVCLGANIHPAAKRAVEELKIHILALNS